MKLTRHQHHAGQQGMALVVTLLFLTVLTLLVCALAVSVRIGLQTTRTHSETLQVRQIGEGATDCAIALLRDAMPAPTNNRAWVLAPGMAWRCDSGVWTQIALYTMATPIPGITNRYVNTTEVITSQGLNLNEQLFLTGEGAQYYYWIITNGFSFIGVTNYPARLVATNFFYQRIGTPIIAGWVNVGPNGQPAGYIGPGTFNYAAYATTNINPLVARWAVWIDADSCKVNLRTAGTRDPATSNSSVPGEVELRALDAPFSSASAAQITNLTGQLLTTPEELRRITSSWAGSTSNDFSRHKFSLSVHGSDENKNAFGEARVNLNTLTLSATNLLADTRYASLLYSNVIAHPNRRSLAAKYGAFGTAQIVANILAYRGVPTDDTLIAAGEDTGIPNQFAGLRRAPLISEFIVHVVTNYPSATNVEVRVCCRLKIVNSHADALTNGYTGELLPESITVEYNSGATNRTTVFTTATNATLTGTIAANSFHDLAFTPFLEDLQWPDTNTPVVTRVEISFRRARLLDNTGQPLDWITRRDFSNALGNATMVFLPASFGSATNSLAGAAAQSIGKQDPRVRTFPAWENVANALAGGATTLTTNWWRYSGGQISLTSDDECSTNFSSRIAPEYYALLADARAAASHRTSPDPVAETAISSVGELSYIHTGYPWRTLRFRSVVPHTTNVADQVAADYQLNSAPYRGIGDPNYLYEGVETNAAPDWLLLDMFTASSNATVAGRINVNALIHGDRVYLPNYVDSMGGSRGYGNFVATTNVVPPRLLPLRALLANTSTNLGPASPWLDIIATEIAERIFVPGSPYARTDRPTAYLTPGEICEVEHLDYFADAIPANKNHRQQALRRISEIITTRSDTFTIWTVAQLVRERTISAGIYSEPDGIYDWVWFQPNQFGWSQWGDGDGQEDQHVNNFSQDLILAQIRIQTVVQRYVDGTGKVCFRTLYTRYWTE